MARRSTAVVVEKDFEGFPLLTNSDTALERESEILMKDVDIRRSLDQKLMSHSDISDELSYFQTRIARDKDIGAGQLLWHEYLRQGKKDLAMIYLVATAILGDEISEQALINKIILDVSQSDEIIELAITHLTCYANEGYDHANDILNNLIISALSEAQAKKIAMLYLKKGGKLEQHRLFIEQIEHYHFTELELV